MYVKINVNKEYNGACFHKGDILKTVSLKEDPNTGIFDVHDDGYCPSIKSYKVWDKERIDWYYFTDEEIDEIYEETFKDKIKNFFNC